MEDKAISINKFRIKLTWDSESKNFTKENDIKPEKLNEDDGDFSDLIKSYEKFNRVLSNEFLRKFGDTVNKYLEKTENGIPSDWPSLIDTVNYFLKHIGWILQTINNPEVRCAVS